MNKGVTILIAILLIASAIGMGFYLVDKAQSSPVVYETDSLFTASIEKKTVATGSVIPRKEIELKSQVSGVVDQIYVEDGDQVKQGQLVAKIRIIPDVVALNNAEANLKAARINLENARKEYKRQKALYQDSVIAEFTFNQYVLDLRLREQEVEAAENNLELIREGASAKSGSVSNLVYSTVQGMILDVPVEEGDFVIETNTFNEGTTIAFVADMNEMIFEGMVDESEVGKLEIGMPLNIKVGAIENETFFAELEHISPKGEEVDGAIQFEIRAAVQLEEGEFLRAGYSANADIVLDKRENVLALKESNLIFEDEKAYVEKWLGEQQFEKVEIQTGLSDGINIEIVSGLDESDKVKKL